MTRQCLPAFLSFFLGSQPSPQRSDWQMSSPLADVLRRHPVPGDAPWPARSLRLAAPGPSAGPRRVSPSSDQLLPPLLIPLGSSTPPSRSEHVQTLARGLRPAGSLALGVC